MRAAKLVISINNKGTLKKLKLPTLKYRRISSGDMIELMVDGYAMRQISMFFVLSVWTRQYTTGQK